jgi:L-alanine-DL-glutamate epimerase-like enolase superfamily enzyme
VLDADGCVKPSETPGLGIEINEAFINAHPLIEGPCYV